MTRFELLNDVDAPPNWPGEIVVQTPRHHAYAVMVLQGGLPSPLSQHRDYYKALSAAQKARAVHPTVGIYGRNKIDESHRDTDPSLYIHDETL